MRRWIFRILLIFTCCNWIIQARDKNESPDLVVGLDSAIAGQWQAQWIWAYDKTDVDSTRINEHVYFRKIINASEKPVVEVAAFVSADDYYKLYLNNIYVGEGPAPSFPTEYNYNKIDLTSVWRINGKNCLAAHAYYQGLKNYRWVSGDNRRGFILQLEITYSDSSQQIIGTDTTWRCKISDAYSYDHKIGYSTSFDENIDANKIPVGWNELDFDDLNWQTAVIQDASQWTLHAQETQMLSVYDQKPVIVTQQADSHYFFDFGREVVGTLRVKFQGQSGQKVEIRLGEELLGPNIVRYDMRCNCKYQDFWTLRAGDQEIEFYDYRAFRYGEIIGAPNPLDTGAISAIIRHYPFDDNAATFTCSDENLTALWELAKYTTKMGTQDVYLDCPTREKAQYTLDTYLEMNAAAYVAGEWNLSRRMIEFALQSSDSGNISCVAPASKRHSFTEYTMYPILMAWQYYLYTGDVGFLRKNYEALIRIENYLRTNFSNSNGLLCNTHEVLNDLVDWPKNRRDGHLIMPVNIVVNSVYYRVKTLLAEISTIIGKEDTALLYEKRANQIYQIINQKLWNKQQRRYVDGMDVEGMVADHSSLHANVFPLAMGLVPPERADDVIAFIKTRGMNCNLFLAMFLFEALFDHGAGDYAFDLLMADSLSTPMSWVRKNATTTWEAWDLEQKWNTSLFHPAGAFVAYIIGSRIMGIQPLEPGFAKFLIKPSPGKLTDGSIQVPTIKGPIQMNFDRLENQFKINVTIPESTSAIVYIPASDAQDVTESSRPINEALGVKFIELKNDFALFEVESGNYSFVSRVPVD